MLVKFLSYIASVIGARRYKSMLFSCLLLLLSVTGVSIVVSAVSGSTPDNASSVQRDTGQIETESSPPELGGLSRQSQKQDNQLRAEPPQASQNSGTPPADSSASPDAASFDIVLNPATVILSAGQSTSQTSVASTSGNTPVSWAIAAEHTDNDVSASLESDKNVSGTTTIRFRSGASTASGEYRFVLTAKDAKGMTVTKTMVIQVVPKEQ